MNAQTNPRTAQARKAVGDQAKRIALTPAEVAQLRQALPRLKELAQAGAPAQTAFAVLGFKGKASELMEFLELDGTPTLQQVVDALTKELQFLHINMVEIGSTVSGLRTTVGSHTTRITALEEILDGVDQEKLAAALKAGNGLGGTATVLYELHELGFSDEEIRKILVLSSDDQELQLSDPKAVASAIRALGVVFDTLTRHAARLDAHDTVLGPNGRNITSLKGRVRHLEDTIIGRFPWWGWPIAGIVGIVTGWFWHIQDFTTITSTKIGNVTVIQTSTSFGGVWWYPWAIGLLVAIVTWGIIDRANRTRSRSQTNVQVQAQSSLAPRSVETTQVLAPVRDEPSVITTLPARIPVADRTPSR